MSGSNRRVVYVGLFVAIAVAIFGGAILAVGSLQNAFSSKIAVSAVFDNVEGLQTGDSIWSSGMRVGVVGDMRFIEPGRVEVTMALDEAMVSFIPSDSEATLGSDGLIGNPLVVLSGGSADAPPVKPGDTLQVGDAVSTAELMATLQENNENLVSITGDIKELTAGLRAGEGTLGRLLTEDDLYVQVQTAMADVEDAAASAKRLTASLSRFTAELNQPGQLPHDLVHDDEIMPSVREAVDSLEAVVGQASSVVEGVSAKLDDPQTPLGTLLGDREAGEDLATTLANLEDATVLLKEDLRAIQSNFLFRPYFRKQERQEKKEARKKAREEAKSQ